MRSEPPCAHLRRAQQRPRVHHRWDVPPLGSEAVPRSREYGGPLSPLRLRISRSGRCHRWRSKSPGEVGGRQSRRRRAPQPSCATRRRHAAAQALEQTRDGRANEQRASERGVQSWQTPYRGSTHNEDSHLQFEALCVGDDAPCRAAPRGHALSPPVPPPWKRSQAQCPRREALAALRSCACGTRRTPRSQRS